jgi:transposase
MCTPHTQTGATFLRAIENAIERGYVRPGTTVVLDNARIHASAPTRQQLRARLFAAGARLIFLPAYTPECNPCEFIFAQVKNILWHSRGPGSLLNEIVRAFSHVSKLNVLNFYRECTQNHMQEF